MSDAGPLPGQGAGGQEPSEEEVRAYLSQLRAAPAAQVVAEVLSALLNAAQVKLGRRDGRLLLDLTASTLAGSREHLPQDLVQQVESALAQLRVAQVEAEGEVANARAQGQTEPNDIGDGDRGADGAEAAGPSGGEPTPPPGTPPAGGPSPDPASRLWIPGR